MAGHATGKANRDVTRRWTFPAAPEAVGAARRATRSLAQESGAGDELVDSIAMCVSEAVTNAVMHAYRDRPEPGEVEVEIELEPSGPFHVRVRDQGVGMRPRGDSPGAGFGLPLITELASDVTIRSGNGSGAGTELEMRFDRGA
jgi:anti-sigma regulatory factor (Ser/Thr protein kinase)